EGSDAGSVRDACGARPSGDTANKSSQKIGADPEQTRSAIDGAIPLLLAALGKQAADPERRSRLQQAITQDHDGSVVDSLQAYLDGQLSGRATDGQGIVNH